LKGKTYTDYFTYRNLDLKLAEEREDNFRKIITEGEAYSFEETYLKGTADEKTIFRKMFPYVSQNDEKYILAYGIDITNVRKANEEILDKNKELNKLNLELDGLVYSVTHDIRSPLHAVLGLIDLIESEEVLNERTQEYISLIKSSINRLDETINMIFDYSKNARTGLQSLEIDFDEIIETSFKHNTKEQKKNIKLIVNKNLKSKFYSDPQRVKSIMNSLISNAVMFSRKEADSFIEINIDLNTELCEITISDNGEGIQEKHQDLIFDMFYRASKKSVGSGLGLFICKEAVEKLKGTIYFTSIPNQGSNFIIKLPNDFCSYEKEIHSN
jgi:signal transduction histidine kinase